MAYKRIKQWTFQDIRQDYTERDSMFYALSVGLGALPLEDRQRAFVYEGKGALQVLPSLAVVLAAPTCWMRNPMTGIDWRHVVPVEQRLIMHRALPAAGSVVGRTHIAAVIDKGKDVGLLVAVERKLYDAFTDEKLATVYQVKLCKGNGGYGGVDVPLAELPAVPNRAPDQCWPVTVSSRAALLYRLNGDANPLHADPDVARAAGFHKPTLQGLCLYGMAANTVLKHFCAYDASRLTLLSVRFAAAVYPGDKLMFDFWLNGQGSVAFQARAIERNITVLSHGVAEFGI